ncbi:MAG: hypothetical protein AAGB31_08265 [Bdellovibrio sp.]
MFRKNPTSLIHRVLVAGLVLVLYGVSAVAFAAPPKYPAVVEFQGPVWLTAKDGQRSPLKGKPVLRDKALFETSGSGRVKVQLDSERSFTVLPDSEISLPAISWESGEAPIIHLRKGSLRWQQKLSEKGAYNVALRSDLFEFLAPPGDYRLTMDPAKAFTSVQVYEGELFFSALNGEESVMVRAGQQAGFQGVFESGEIAYDVLLKGKKIPKGVLTPVTAIDTKELDREAEQEKQRLKAEQERKARKKAALVKKKRPGEICSEPSAKFNECAWVCVSNPKKEKKLCLVEQKEVSCVRRRCNANGVWAEEAVLDAAKASTLCKAQPVVGLCDY